MKIHNHSLTDFPDFLHHKDAIVESEAFVIIALAFTWKWYAKGTLWDPPGMQLDMKYSRFRLLFLYTAGELHAVEDTDVSTGERKPKRTALSECCWGKLGTTLCILWEGGRMVPLAHIQIGNRIMH